MAESEVVKPGQLEEEIEDAFVQALEEGANPPREFTISLPWSAFVDIKETVLRVAGFVLRLVPVEVPEDDAEWVH